MILQVPFMFTFSKLGLVYLITIILVYAFNEF